MRLFLGFTAFLFASIGIGAVVYGAWLAYPPAAWIIGGAWFYCMAINISQDTGKKQATK